MENGSVGRDGEDEGDDVDQREDQQEVDLSHFLPVNLFLRIKPEIFRAKIIIFILRIKDISTGWTRYGELHIHQLGKMHQKYSKFLKSSICKL